MVMENKAYEREKSPFMGAFPRPVKSVEEMREEMWQWMRAHPKESQEASAWLEQACATAPMHASLLSELTRRFGVPKPISVFVQLCPSLQYYSAKFSPNGHPCVVLARKAQDEAYLGRLTTGTASGGALSPWAMLGASPREDQSLTQRVKIFHAFLETTYGLNIGKDMAAVCADFKQASGVPFNAFFNGLRPADLQRLPVANYTLEWSWSNSTPPVLSCRAKRVYTIKPEVSADLVERLAPIVAKTHPEALDIEALAMQFKVAPPDILASYLPALKKALDNKVETSYADLPDMKLIAERLSAIAATLVQVTQEVAELAQLTSRAARAQLNAYRIEK